MDMRISAFGDPGNSTPENLNLESALNEHSRFITNAATRSSRSSDRPRWFELVINSGDGEKRLGEVHLTGIETGGQFFKAIKQRYDAFRGNLAKRLYLLKPVDIQFVQFSLQDRYRVFIHDKPKSWPLETAVAAGQWEYQPPQTCPPAPPPPMPADAFLQYFAQAASQHPRAVWLPRTPKKLQRNMADERVNLPIGWGILIVEGLNKKLASWITFTTMAVVFAFGTGWSIYTEKGVSVSNLALMAITLIGSFVTSEFFEQLDA